MGSYLTEQSIEFWPTLRTLELRDAG